MELMLQLLLILLIICLVLFLLFVFMVHPVRCGKEKKALLYHRNFAHRGLHTRDLSVPENSMAAFARAIEKGYGIELDIQFSKDEQVVVFHDNTLPRVCHVEGRVDDYPYETLRTFSLQGTKETIPLFTEVLALVDGKVPLIVELKNGKKNRLLCEKAYEILSAYKGAFCIESFQPFIVRWFYKHAPHILRGQLSARPKEFRTELSPVAAFLAGNLMLDFLSHPEFIAYDKCEKIPFCVSLTKQLGAVQAVWTIRTPEEGTCFEAQKDTLIFELYEPKIRF